ncbi:MAG: response regulator transcription factor [Syntrophobacteraceae bacterium]|nr:response regulator transcription factor [Syntrophobacteraceae bacterium]
MSRKERILVIDDDKKLNRLLSEYLSPFGYEVLTAASPEEGLRYLKTHPPELIILDIMLPDVNGFELCKIIRENHAIPIIMLTARGEVTDRIVGLELGADDYLSKPFEPRELVARIQAVLRRAVGAPRPQVRSFGRLSIDSGKRKALLDGQPLSLTTNEFAALALLARNAGRVLDRDQLLQELRGIDSEAFNRSVDITISRLRQKLGDDPKDPSFIKTVWGAGYLFVAEDPRNDI